MMQSRNSTITTNECKFKIGDKVKSTYAYEGMIGYVVKISKAYSTDKFFTIGVKFNQQKAGMHTIDGLLPDNTGYVYRENDLMLLKKLTPQEFFQQNYSTKKDKLQKKILYEQSNIRTYKRYIDEYQNKANHCLDNIKKYKAERKNCREPIEEIALQLINIKKNKLVDKIDFGFSHLIITTKPLKYSSDKYNSPFGFELGRYKIFISSANVKAINITKQCGRGNYFHPCIEHTGEICLGSNVRDAIYSYEEKGDVDLIVNLVINFLQEPN